MIRMSVRQDDRIDSRQGVDRHAWSAYPGQKPPEGQLKIWVSQEYAIGKLY
jgi:hypothetical protein